jgi:hypothetical protein
MIFVLAAASALNLSAAPAPFGNARHPVTSEVARSAPMRREPPREPPKGDFLGVAYGFYRTVVTPIDGPRCSHRPTCSAYAREAVRLHGLVGLWLAYDRLLRDSHSSAARRLPVAFQHGRIVFLDPLEESTFWLP